MSKQKFLERNKDRELSNWEAKLAGYKKREGCSSSKGKEGVLGAPHNVPLFLSPEAIKRDEEIVAQLLYRNLKQSLTV